MKTVMLNVRLSPAYKKALIALAEREHRTISGQIEHWIATHSAEAGVSVDSGRGAKKPAKRPRRIAGTTDKR
jgi:hypothetical protein